MKALTLILTMILAQQVYASNSCFDSQAVRELIEASEELDDCFANDEDKCKFNKMTAEQQREVNGQRLIPYDRTQSELMNNATGVVAARFSDRSYGASSQKISRCHIITSAHLLYKDMDIAVDSEDLPILKDSEQFDLNFHSGQTCDSRLFEKKVGAQLFFKMTKENKDFVCDRKDNYGKCLGRTFYGKSDLVILKLKDYDKDDTNFFKLKTTQITTSKTGDRVTCWGYPGYNNQIRLEESLSNRMLWMQKDAKIFQGEHASGILTNATAYPGMSGGGCVASSNPKELVGVYSNKNSATGHSTIRPNVKTGDLKNANFLSSFKHLAERYKQATNKDIADLDKECD